MPEKDNIFSFRQPEENAGFLMWQISMLWQLKMKRGLDRLNLTLTQFSLLAGVYWLTKGGAIITQKNLADYANTDRMMTSKVLRTLQQKKLLTRAEHETDTRAKTISITAQGIELLERANEIVKQIDEAFFSKLQTKQEGFIETMRTLYEENK